MKFQALVFLACVCSYSGSAQQCDSITWLFGVNQFVIDGDRLADDLLAHGFDRDFFVTHTGELSIEAATDCPGSSVYNQQLAGKRSAYLENCIRWYFSRVELLSANSFPEPGCTEADEKTYEPGKRRATVKMCWSNPVVSVPDSLPAQTSLISPEVQEAPLETPQQMPVETAETAELEKMTELKVGETLVLGGLNFYPGKHRTLPDAQPVLEKLVQMMRENPTMVIEIQGHVCCSDRPNQDGVDDETGEKKLSWNRAEFVHDYLIEHGIEKDRVSFRGYAMKKPLVYPERGPEDQKRNRRVEVMIISK